MTTEPNDSTLRRGYACTMTSIRAALLATYFVTAHVDAAADPVNAIKAGQPRDVAAYIDRYVACIHWGGEEPYDKERAAEINRAMKKLRCDRLDADELSLVKKHDGDAKVVDAIRRIKSLYY